MNAPFLLTEAAANRAKMMLAKRGHGLGIRIGVKVSGCTGYSYVVDYADSVGEADKTFVFFGVTVVVRDEHIPFFEGTEVDYVKQNLLNEGFEFRNPNVVSECGCGESVSFKEAKAS